MIGCSPSPQRSASLSSDANVSQKGASSNLPLSDDAYIAYRNQHESSPKISGMILTMIRLHMQAGEYQLARFYCDEYRRDFPSGNRRTEVEYLRVKALFSRYRQGHDERIAEQAKGEAKTFLSVYRHSAYRSKVQALLGQMQQEENLRYAKLAKYYEGKGKPKAAAFYRAKIKKSQGQTGKRGQK